MSNLFTPALIGLTWLCSSALVAPLAQSGTTPLGGRALGTAASCPPRWRPTFGGQPGVNGHLLALRKHDDGGGPALFAGGDFTSAGGVEALDIAKWDGRGWSALGSGVDGISSYVAALTEHDDGGGPALYAGGMFTSAGGVAAQGIAKWDGASWSALASGVNGAVRALAQLDDGSGPALYAGGDFTSAGGLTTCKHIARWDGTSWSALGTGMNGSVEALAVFDDGGGPALYAGGTFTSAGGVPASRIAKWDGTSWSALGTGMNGSVEALAVFDDGSGPALCAGGAFTSAGSAAASCVAQWDGASWSALGSGMAGGDGIFAVPSVSALAELDDGGRPALYAGGYFTSAGGAAASSVAKWNGTGWSALGGGVGGQDTGFSPYVAALAAFDAGGGPALYAGGLFESAEGLDASGIARWEGTGWSALGSGVGAPPYALAEHDDGSGPALYAGGAFTSAGGVVVNRIGKWDGASWSALGSGVAGDFASVSALTGFDDGSGPALCAGGNFTGVGGAAATFIAKWDGTSWSALGSGVNNLVSALLEFDDGGGPALYAGGYFTSAGGVAASRIAKWDGASWSALGSGLSGFSPSIQALAVFDDGGGPALYAGGEFTSAGGVGASNVAKWNGASWSALGSGAGGEVRALTVFDDGGGPALYAGGEFTSAGGTPASSIAKWDGASWSALGSGVSAFDVVYTLAVFDDGSGPALYAGGDFTSAGGGAASGIAQWDGTSWSALGTGMSSAVYALTEVGDGGAAALYAGGAFTVSPGGDSFLAKWGCAAITPVQGCAGNPATLAALAPSAPLGAPLPLKIKGSAVLSGVGAVYFGTAGTDGSGCGLFVPSLGELLLAPAPPPHLLSLGTLAGGSCILSPLVPSTPALSGVTVHLQGLALHFLAPELLELANALAVTLGP